MLVLLQSVEKLLIAEERGGRGDGSVMGETSWAGSFSSNGFDDKETFLCLVLFLLTLLC